MTNMRWSGLQLRMSRWFAETLIQGEAELASRLARLATWFRDAGAAAPEAIGLILDYLEAAELYRSERPPDEPLDVAELRAVVADLEELIFGFAPDADTSGEPAAPYLLR